jgi:hypothetical protein
MKRLIEVPLTSGGSILVETEIIPSGKILAHAGPNAVIKANETMESVLSEIKPVILGIVKDLIVMKPDEITVELGMGVNFGSDGILKMLIATGANASLKVNVKWKEPEKSGSSVP